MKIEKLKYFLDLYENGSYTQTAKINYISQTSVTQFINSLETEFKVKLFNRTTIPITPTEAGRAFYKRAELMYSQYVSSLDSMKSFASNATIPLNISYTSPIDLPILLPIVKNFKKEHPEIKVTISKCKIKDTYHALKSYECDMIMGILPFNEKPDDGIFSVTVYEGHYCAAVSKEDPLAEQDSVTLADAYSHPLVLLSPSEIGNNYNAMLEFLAAAGIKPNIQANATDIPSELFMIATEHYLGFVPDNFDFNYFDDHIVKVPISDMPVPFHLDLAYKAENNPSIELFLDSLKHYSKTE